MQKATVLERGRIERAKDDCEFVSGTELRRVLPARLYDRLERSEFGWKERGEGAVFDWERRHATIGPWVGVIQIPGLQLEILPKTDVSGAREGTVEGPIENTRRNLLEMLAVGGFATARPRGVADLHVGQGDLHDRLIKWFLDRVLLELQSGADRAYDTVEDNLPTLRGKLVLSRHVPMNAAQRNRFFCRHDVFDAATPISVRLKQACHSLSGWQLSLTVGAKCQQALALLEDVPDQPFRSEEHEPVFTRQNERFASIYRFATMVLRGHSPHALGGGVETFSLLFDMDQVFERFIAAFLARNVMSEFAAASLHPQSAGHRLPLYDDKGNHVLKMKPDLLFISAAGVRPQRFIIDTKWKRLEPNKELPENSDLYQLYAYVRRYDCKRAFFLYPEVPGVTKRDLQVLGDYTEKQIGTVGVRFVDVSSPKLWTIDGRRVLAEKLKGLVHEGLGSTPEIPGTSG